MSKQKLSLKSKGTTKDILDATVSIAALGVMASVIKK